MRSSLRSHRSPDIDQRRRQGKQRHGIDHCLLGYTYTLSKHHAFSQVSTTCPFSRQLPEKHVCSQHNTLPRVCFSQTSSQKTVSRKLSCNTTESPKKPEVSTSSWSRYFVTAMEKQLIQLPSTKTKKNTSVSGIKNPRCGFRPTLIAQTHIRHSVLCQHLEHASFDPFPNCKILWEVKPASQRIIYHWLKSRQLE